MYYLPVKKLKIMFKNQKCFGIFKGWDGFGIPFCAKKCTTTTKGLRRLYQWKSEYLHPYHIRYIGNSANAYLTIMYFPPSQTTTCVKKAQGTVLHPAPVISCWKAATWNSSIASRVKYSDLREHRTVACVITVLVSTCIILYIYIINNLFMFSLLLMLYVQTIGFWNDHTFYDNFLAAMYG